jgi:hypothetical protein
MDPGEIASISQRIDAEGAGVCSYLSTLAMLVLSKAVYLGTTSSIPCRLNHPQEAYSVGPNGGDEPGYLSAGEMILYTHRPLTIGLLSPNTAARWHRPSDGPGS